MNSSEFLDEVEMIGILHQCMEIRVSCCSIWTICVKPYDEGYYVLEVFDLTFAYVGKEVNLSKYARSDETEE